MEVAERRGGEEAAAEIEKTYHHHHHHHKHVMFAPRPEFTTPFHTPSL
jgi:hypothetical protein